MSNQCKANTCGGFPYMSDEEFDDLTAYIDSIYGDSAQEYEEEDQSETVPIPIDTYDVHHAFNVQDPSGCLQRASRIILMSGMMNPEDDIPQVSDIMEARDMLTRWLELNS